ncbi:MAG: alpha/beta fold hydrolase [Oscillochloridaceae bacterium umkhey_bin13]
MIAKPPHNLTLTVNGVELAVYEWPGDGPPILFVHANSFHARCWDPVVAHLPGRRCLALDLRGHGQSAKPPPPYAWPQFGNDVAELVQALGLRQTIAVGHSLGGYAITLAAALAPTAFAALILIDPVILEPQYYFGRAPGVHGAARRRKTWPSPAALYARLHERPPFEAWHPAALHAYCDHALVPDPGTQDLTLACPPEIEADIYYGATAHPIYAEISTIQLPTLVVRGHPYDVNPAENLSASPTPPGLAAAFANGRDLHLPQHSHFIPMEDPALVARLVKEMHL